MTMMEVRIERGIETAMINVLRQLPRKIRIIRPVRTAAMRPSRNTPSIDAPVALAARLNQVIDSMPS